MRLLRLLRSLAMTALTGANRKGETAAVVPRPSAQPKIVLSTPNEGKLSKESFSAPGNGSTGKRSDSRQV